MNQNRVKDGMMFKIENDPRIIGGKEELEILSGIIQLMNFHSSGMC